MVQFPELNITYNYIYKEDLSPDTIVEFNKNSHVDKNTTVQYVKDHDASLGHYGVTWVGPPFIQEISAEEGDEHRSQRFVLRFKAAQSDSLVDSIITKTANQNLGNKIIT